MTLFAFLIFLPLLYCLKIYTKIQTKIGIEIKAKSTPKATELTARLLSNLAFITIAPAKVIVGVALSMIATMVEVFISKPKIFKKNIKIKGAKIILAKITRMVGL